MLAYIVAMAGCLIYKFSFFRYKLHWYRWVQTKPTDMRSWDLHKHSGQFWVWLSGWVWFAWDNENMHGWVRTVCPTCALRRFPNTLKVSYLGTPLTLFVYLCLEILLDLADFFWYSYLSIIYKTDRQCAPGFARLTPSYPLLATEIPTAICNSLRF